MLQTTQLAEILTAMSGGAPAELNLISTEARRPLAYYLLSPLELAVFVCAAFRASRLPTTLTRHPWEKEGRGGCTSF